MRMLSSATPALLLHTTLTCLAVFGQGVRHREFREQFDGASAITLVERGAIGTLARKTPLPPDEAGRFHAAARLLREGQERKAARPFDGAAEFSQSLGSEDREIDLVPMANLAGSELQRAIARNKRFESRAARGDEGKDASAIDPRAIMQSPLYGSLLGADQLFTWYAGYAAQGYWLWVGSCQDCTDIFDGSVGLAQSLRVNMPMDGRRIYVTLFTFSQGFWWWHDYQYTAPAFTTSEAAQILDPTAGSTLSSNQTFHWNSGAGVSSYYLWVGSCRDCTDLLDRDMGSARAFTMRLPTDGRTIYVTLFSFIGNSWYWYDYSYIAPRGSSRETNPITITISNKLARPVNISVNGTVVGSVPANETRNHEMRASTMTVSWTLQQVEVSGREIGDAMGGRFGQVDNPSGTYSYTIDNTVGESFYFNPWITNNSANRLWMEANGGLNSQNRCDCFVAPGQERVTLGYYRMYSNSNVRGFRNNGYTGAYSYWGTDSNGSVAGRKIPEIAEAESGITRLVAR